MSSFHEIFTPTVCAVKRLRAAPAGQACLDGPSAVKATIKEKFVMTRMIGALASAGVLAIGLGACGSSSSSSSSGTSSGSGAATTASGGANTISGAGSTFAAPVYMQWGSQLSPLTVNYQAVG